jgi:hypothetical protein
MRKEAELAETSCINARDLRGETEFQAGTDSIAYVNA